MMPKEGLANLALGINNLKENKQKQEQQEERDRLLNKEIERFEQWKLQRLYEDQM